MHSYISHCQRWRTKINSFLNEIYSLNTTCVVDSKLNRLNGQISLTANCIYDFGVCDSFAFTAHDTLSMLHQIYDNYQSPSIYMRARTNVQRRKHTLIRTTFRTHYTRTPNTEPLNQKTKRLNNSGVCECTVYTAQRVFNRFSWPKNGRQWEWERRRKTQKQFLSLRCSHWRTPKIEKPLENRGLVKLTKPTIDFNKLFHRPISHARITNNNEESLGDEATTNHDEFIPEILWVTWTWTTSVSWYSRKLKIARWRHNLTCTRLTMNACWCCQ